MNESFGARLRRQRERQHITLGQIAASTKIQASLFEGLERNDVSRWPGGIFRRSFIRAYAEAVGLNADQICREFLERFPEPFPDGLSALAVGQGAVVLPPRPAPPAPRPTPAPQVVLEEIIEPPAVLAVPDLDRAEMDSAPRLLLADGASGGQPTPPIPAEARPGLVIGSVDARWQAAALDAGSVFLLALAGYAVFGTFWAPLAVTSLVYSAAATLWWGRTPGSAYIAGALSLGRLMPIATQARPTASPERAPEKPATTVDARPDVRETLDALEVLTLESLPQPAMQLAEADVASNVRPAAYPTLRPPFDLERRRRARA